MEANFLIIGLVLAVAVILIIFMIRKNRKDEKNFEEDMNKESTVPESKKGKGHNI